MRPTHLTTTLILLTLLGCETSKKMRFEPASQGAKGINVSIVEFGQTSSAGEPLGSLPVEIELEKATGRSVRLSAKGYDDQFWVIPEKLGESNTVKIRLKPRVDNSDKLFTTQAKASLLLMKSYKALVEKNFDLARSLADQSEKVLNLGPGTTIIKAIASWQQGDRKKARTLIQEAKAVYPNTTELDELLQAVNKP